MKELKFEVEVITIRREVHVVQYDDSDEYHRDRGSMDQEGFSVEKEARSGDSIIVKYSKEIGKTKKKEGGPLTHKLKNLIFPERRKVINEFVQSARDEGLDVKIDYIDRHGEVTERVVTPEVIGDRSFLDYCKLRSGTRNFAYDSIQDIRQQER